ncbi:hypothetical protein DFH06DRAFT_578140 [Mycena polygramma]|nr:hypothetical protein DFH06DRAFT_578140 [Mycena polygramma]
MPKDGVERRRETGENAEGRQGDGWSICQVRTLNPVAVIRFSPPPVPRPLLLPLLRTAERERPPHAQHHHPRHTLPDSLILTVYAHQQQKRRRRARVERARVSARTARPSSFEPPPTTRAPSLGRLPTDRRMQITPHAGRASDDAVRQNEPSALLQPPPLHPTSPRRADVEGNLVGRTFCAQSGGRNRHRALLHPVDCALHTAVTGCKCVRAHASSEVGHCALAQFPHATRIHRCGGKPCKWVALRARMCGRRASRAVTPAPFQRIDRGLCGGRVRWTRETAGDSNIARRRNFLARHVSTAGARGSCARREY